MLLRLAYFATLPVSGTAGTDTGVGYVPGMPKWTRVTIGMKSKNRKWLDLRFGCGIVEIFCWYFRVFDRKDVANGSGMPNL